MALTKRTTKPATTKATAAEPVENDFTSVTISRGFTIGMGDFSGVKVSVMLTGTDPEALSAKVEELLSLEVEKAGVQFQTYAGGEGDAEVEEAEGDAEEGGEEGEEEDGIDAEAVMSMDRKALEALVVENELEVDPADFAKNKAGLNDFREAVVAVAFPDGDEAEEDGEEEEGEEGEEDAIDEDTINAMDRPALLAFIKDQEIDVDPKKHTKLSALKTAVIDALAAASEEDGEEEAEEAEEDAEGYTEADLKEMSVDDLKAIFTDWEIGKFPPGPPKTAKGLAIKKILAFQAQAE